MNSRRRKKKIGQYLGSKLLLIGIFAIMLFLANASFKMYSKSQEAKEYLEATEKEYTNLQEQYESVTDDLEYLNSGTGLEKEIRSKFDLAREGEKAILIIEEDLPEVKEPEPKSFWKKVVDWVSF